MNEKKEKSFLQTCNKMSATDQVQVCLKKNTNVYLQHRSVADPGFSQGAPTLGEGGAG